MIGPPKRVPAPVVRARAPHLPRLLLVCLLAGVPLAHAEPKDDARRHFQAGLLAAQNQEYQKALDEFLAAQAAWPHPASLYNIGRSYADLGDLPNAIAYYELYRVAAPEKAADVDPLIAVYRARLQQASAPEVPPTAAPAPAPGSAATAEELARLKAIAAELSAMSEAIAVRAAEAPAPPPPEGTAPTPTVPTPAPTPTPDAPALRSDAYERVVITASRYGQAPLDSPSTITVLTEGDIRQAAATSVPDLLRRVAGVDVMALAAGKPDVSIRGFNRELSNKVLVLVDGRSVYVDFLGTPLWGAIPVALEEIERIEIIRGPGSAIYGANAMTGVVNIITRTPGEGGSQLHVSGGSPGYLSGTALADGRKGPTSWRFSAGWDQTGRWSASPAVAPDGALVPFTPDQDTSLAVARANGRVDRAFLEKGLASVSGGYVGGFTEFYALGALGDYAMDFRGGYLRGDLAYGPVHLRSFYDALAGPTGPWAEYAGARSLNTTFDSDTFDTELEALGDFDTGSVHHRLNAGAGYRYKRIELGYLAEGAPIVEHHLNAFLQEEARVGDLSLVASLRADRHPLVPLNETISPRGAAIFRVADRTSVRLTGGTAFRAPTFLESYLDLDQPTDAEGVFVHTYGDTTLSPERILTGELGLHDESTSVHVADLALYVNRVTQLIGLTDVVPEVSPFDPEANGFAAGSTGFTNLDTVYTAAGGEIDGRVFPTDGVDVYANLAIERVLETEDGTTVPDGSTSLVKFNTGASWRTPWRTDAAIHLNYVSPQAWRLRDIDENGILTVTTEEIPARTVLAARLAVHPFADDAFEVAVDGWNLLALGGDSFREHPKGQLVGPRVWGEVAWRF